MSSDPQAELGAVLAWVVKATLGSEVEVACVGGVRSDAELAIARVVASEFGLEASDGSGLRSVGAAGLLPRLWFDFFDSGLDPEASALRLRGGILETVTRYY